MTDDKDENISVLQIIAVAIAAGVIVAVVSLSGGPLAHAQDADPAQTEMAAIIKSSADPMSAWEGAVAPSIKHQLKGSTVAAITQCPPLPGQTPPKQGEVLSFQTDLVKCAAPADPTKDSGKLFKETTR